MIKVVDYNPNWPQEFEALKTVFSNALGDVTDAIEHVGSTSVPGLAAKPILDIDIIVKGETQLHKVIPVMTSLGYQFAGEMGIKDRYAFNAVSNLNPDNRTGTLWPAHHLYCCIAGSLALNNHLLFRDALRDAPELAREYGQLKKRLATETSDIDTYVSSKSSFIAGDLNKAGLSSDLIKAVVEQNRKK
ncbi:GrpB family protein [Pedobacter sp. PLR]|uniref:GrpB family protein n=1 Tax=Pedobacter sp. PLR TaxID=2994465 RepID=UPI0022485164|nr:GrpB family protein [Pedobacter sp. PLR]MCX2452100.1 GrpB family protein [Pedobacter sp. PLR]